MMPSFKTRMIIFACCLLLVGVIVTTAATDCPALVQYALKTIDDACSDTGRNQACYGNITLLAEPQPGMDRLPFRQKGDRVNLVDVKSLKLSGMDTTSNTWGVALLKVQANLADTLPGQNVTLLLFGDVGLDNVQTPTTSPASSAPVFGPMQAFTFRTGLHDAPCEQAPSSGILIQSPAEAKVQLRINAVDITLGSTIYLQLTSPTEMTVSVVEGQATLTAFGKTVVAPAGTRVRVAVDATTLAASAAPSDAEPNVAADLANLPLQHLPIVDSVTPTLEVAALVTPTPEATQQPTPSTVSSDLPLAGDWHTVYMADPCQIWKTGDGVTSSLQFMFVDKDGTNLLIYPTGQENRVQLQIQAGDFSKRVAPGVYVFQVGNSVMATTTVHTNKLITVHTSGRADGCIGDSTLTYIGPSSIPTSTPAN